MVARSSIHFGILDHAVLVNRCVRKYFVAQTCFWQSEVRLAGMFTFSEAINVSAPHLKAVVTLDIKSVGSKKFFQGIEER